MKKYIGTLILALIAQLSFADAQTSKTFGEHTVHFSALNSSFITPEIADTYRITRGKDKGLVNIALTKGDAIGGITAVVQGYVQNIFAQQQTLNFFEVREGDAVYYLAPFSFDNEDFLTFKIQVQKDASSESFPVSFQRTFYYEE